MTERSPADLVPFAPEHGAAVVAWVRSPEEASWWAGDATLFPPDAALLDAWLTAPGVHGFVLLDDGAPCAYGEVWEDPDEREAELARILVAPERRGRGVGRRLAALLAGAARGLGYDDVWLRVRADNAAALACYRAAGFVRAAADAEARFNAGQPHAYVWMRASAAAA